MKRVYVMKRFFTYTSPYRTGISHDLNMMEYFLPFVVLIGLAVLLYKYKAVFKNNQKLDKVVRYTVGVVFIVVYSSHYILRFYLYGWDTIILPFHLCSISMFFAIILIYTKNKTIFSFVLYTGVLGGLISYFTPVIGYNSEFYRYYQFYIAHGILILTPLYFVIVHNFYPTKKHTINAFLILQVIAVAMGFFNYFTNSDFMFIFVDPTKINKFPLIRYFGGIPYYLILVEIAGISLFYIMYKFMCYFSTDNIKTNDIVYKKA